MSNDKDTPDFLTIISGTKSDLTMFTRLVTGTGEKPDSSIPIPKSALPRGYAYKPSKTDERKREGKGLRTVAFHAHPSDISGDFLPYLFLLEKGMQNAAFQPVILSMGEGTKAKERDEFKDKDIVQVRIEEESAACDILGMNRPYYLKDNVGNSFPDGGMMDHLPAIRDSIKAYIINNNPERIVLPSPYPDHADHLAVYIAGMSAIQALQQEGYFAQHGSIEILACEPEFGITKGRQPVLNKLPKQFGGNKEMSHESLAGIQYPRYRFALDEAGKVNPTKNIFDEKQDRATHLLSEHIIAPAPYIVQLKLEMVQQKISALEAHRTQVDGTGYKEPIALLDHLRGEETGAQWGVGIYPINIPGVTRGDSPFLDNLEPSIVFQLEKTRHISKENSSPKR